MDFKKFDTRTPQEKGAFLHFRAIEEYGGHEIYTGEGTDDWGRWVDKDKPALAVGAMVRGMESQTVRDRLRAARAAQMRNPNKPVDEEKLGTDLAQALIIEFVNVEMDGRPVTNSRVDIEKFLELSDDFADQIVEFAKDRSNFFGETPSS